MTVRVGPAVALGHTDPKADTAAIMSAIAALVPTDGLATPSADDLARTYPPGQDRPPAAQSLLAEGAPS